MKTFIKIGKNEKRQEDIDIIKASEFKDLI